MSARQIALAVLWTLPSWVLEAAVILVAAEALGVELSITTAVAVTAFTILFQVFHVTPGGIGVYEAVMTGALYAHGVPWEQGLALAVTTHGLKFAYSYTVALVFTLTAFSKLPELNPLGRIRGDAHGSKAASRFEVIAARLWNVLNEGKPFTPVFVLGVLGLLSISHLTDASYWPRAGIAIAALLPLFLLFYRFDFPLKLRAALWLALAVFLGVFRFVDLTALALVLGLYLTFTVFLWGTVYYHLRIGTPWTNFTRFWRLVLENPDPTSGNFLEQIPKTLLLVLAFLLMVERPGLDTVAAVEGFVLGLGAAALLAHQWFFTWPPAPSLTPTRLVAEQGRRRCKRFIAIVIDGCRADRLLEADTPFIDRMRREGVDYVNTSTVYPARTVTGFSSMFTGAPPKAHGMRSNFVPSLGVKCESIFDSLRESGMKGKLVGIAHLVDAFGDDVETVTAVTHNDEIDDALVARAKAVMERDDPDLLALQLLSVDQTGHARGSYNSEYLAKIEDSDRKIEEFLGWCRDKGYLDDETTVLITSDHGQGIGIGGARPHEPRGDLRSLLRLGRGRGPFDRLMESFVEPSSRGRSWMWLPPSPTSWEPSLPLSPWVRFWASRSSLNRTSRWRSSSRPTTRRKTCRRHSREFPGASCTTLKSSWLTTAPPTGAPRSPVKPRRRSGGESSAEPWPGSRPSHRVAGGKGNGRPGRRVHRRRRRVSAGANPRPAGSPSKAVRRTTFSAPATWERESASPSRG